MKKTRRFLGLISAFLSTIIVVPSAVYALSCTCVLSGSCGARPHCTFTQNNTEFCKQFCTPPCVAGAGPHESYGSGCCEYNQQTWHYTSDETGTCDINPCINITFPRYGSALQCQSSSGHKGTCAPGRIEVVPYGFCA